MLGSVVAREQAHHAEKIDQRDTVKTLHAPNTSQQQR